MKKKIKESDGATPPATSVGNMSVDFAPGAFFKPKVVQDRRYKSGKVVLLKRFRKHMQEK